MTRTIVGLAVLVAIFGASCRKDEPAPAGPPKRPRPTPSAAAPSEAPTAKQLEAAEAAAVVANTERPACSKRVVLFSGATDVDATTYTTPMPHGAPTGDGPISGLDARVSSAASLRFTLDYPFQKPFSGTVKAPLTLRSIIDAIRGGFRTMYGGASVKDIPGMMNKDVTGTYGRAFHAIGDLVIEEIALCDGSWLDISIGS